MLLVLLATTAGCAREPGTSPGASSPSPTGAIAASSPIPSDPAATETPEVASPEPTAASPEPCPTGSPLSVEAYQRADRSCFGSGDIEIEGWEDIPDGIGGTGPSFEPLWLGAMYPTTASVLSSRLFNQPCDQGASACAIAMVFLYTAPTSNVRFEFDGHWVIVTGHRNDPAAETCRYTGSEPTGMSAEEIRQTCRDHFVITAVRDAIPPASALPACPPAGTLRVADFFAFDPACFAGRDVTVVGWWDKPPAIGLLPPGIEPAWIGDLPSGPSVLWQIPPAMSADQACTASDCTWLGVAVDPASSLTLPTSGWSRITGHRDDPAAETCRWMYPAGTPDSERQPDSWARQHCRSAFVITSVAPASPPR